MKINNWLTRIYAVNIIHSLETGYEEEIEERNRRLESIESGV